MDELTILGIKPLTNQMGEQFYPKTTTDAVFQPDSETGQATETTLTQILDSKADAPSSTGWGGNFLTYNELTNQLEDSGYNNESFATAAQGAKADTAYQKPQTGIPESDLSSDVQQALQKHFKGWYNTLAELKAVHTATDGDSAYVKDASPATTWSIYVYDATATTDNYWADSGTDADTSNVQTFASGEEVNEVHIVNDLTTGGVDDVLSAEQGKEIGEILNGTPSSEELIGNYDSTSFNQENKAYTRTPMSSGYYQRVVANNINSTQNANVGESLAIEIPTDFSKIEVVAMLDSIYYYGVCFLDKDGNGLGGLAVDTSAPSGENTFKTIYPADIEAFPTAKFIVVAGRNGSSEGQLLSDCYCKIYKENKQTQGLVETVNLLSKTAIDSYASSRRLEVFNKLKDLKIFFIANSFAVQSTAHLPEQFTKIGYNVTIGISYLGGAILQQYDERKDSNLTNVYVKYKEGSWIYPSSGNTHYDTLINMLKDEDWDIVFFIQGSQSAGLYSTYEPYFTDLLAWLPTKVVSLGYKVGWLMPWAWTDEKISTDGGNLDGGITNAEMYANICSATEDNIDAHENEVLMLLPCGTAVENMLEHGYTQSQIWVDGQHLDNAGIYAANLTLFHVIAKYFCNKGLNDITRIQGVDLVGDTTWDAAKQSALDAISAPYEMTVIS